MRGGGGGGRGDGGDSGGDSGARRCCTTLGSALYRSECLCALMGPISGRVGSFGDGGLEGIAGYRAVKL